MKKILLSPNFFLKATDKNWYLFNISDRSFISEAYQITEKQYKLLLKTNGEFFLEDIYAYYTENQLPNVKKFVKKLFKIGALKLTDENNVKLRKFVTPSKEPHLRGLHLELTKKCNLNCLHCYQTKFDAKAKGNLNIDDIKKLAEEAEMLNTINLSVSGGEPFIEDNLFEVLNIFEKRGIKIGNIFSNGILINSKVIRNLKKLKSNPHIIISLDGPDAQTHGLMRNIKNSDRIVKFNKIIDNIKLLNNNGIVVKINTTIHKGNLDKLIGMHNLLESLNVKMWRIAIPKYVGSYIDNQEKVSIDFSKLKNRYLELVEYYLQKVRGYKNKIVVPFDLRISNTFKTEMLTQAIVKYSLNSSTCEYTRNRISIKSNGDVTSCSMLGGYIQGNIKTKSLSSIWYSKKMQKMKNLSIGEIDTCNKCEYYPICGSGCRVNSLFKYGNLYCKDDETCKCFEFFGDIVKLSKKYGFKIEFAEKFDKYKNRTRLIQIKGTELYL